MKAAAATYKRKTIAIPDDDANGTTIRILREQCGMTQMGLADRLGISDAYLSQMERGHASMDEETFEKAKAAVIEFKSKHKS